jgi:hypothetical protein
VEKEHTIPQTRKNRDVQALKHYFLIDRGDLLLSFLDAAEDEMAKPQQHVSLPRLQTLLDLGTPLPKPLLEVPMHFHLPEVPHCQTLLFFLFFLQIWEGVGGGLKKSIRFFGVSKSSVQIAGPFCRP